MLNCIKQNILCIPMLLIFFVVILTFYITSSHVFHENFHKLAIKLTSNLYNINCNNPIEIAEIVGIFADNIDDFQLKMWISLDKDVYINITKDNVNRVIKYLYERFPY